MAHLSIPFTAASTIGWFVSRSGKDDGVQHDEKDYSKSSKAFDWLETKYKEEEKEWIHSIRDHRC